jgi:YHS domain-containing protein
MRRLGTRLALMWPGRLPVTTERCTICAAPVQNDKGAILFYFEGQPFHFCTLDCLKIFQAYPLAYAHGEDTELNSVEDSGF